MEKNFRIRTNIGSDSVVRVNLRQDIDTFDILSLNISADNSYKNFSANYGVVVGRVVGNGGIGIPNAKISVFIPLNEADEHREDIVALYPYKNVTDLDADGRRYNLLPATYHDNTHVAVGTFPSAQMILDNDICLEVFEKYYKLSTVTNHAGDYMITNVPVGAQIMHMDVDISDIDYLSQKPYDLMFKGYDKSLFESTTKFKGGTNLDDLQQIYSQNETINVYPFWGDDSENEVAITRKDFTLQYEFQPTAVFMGSAFTDQDSNYVSETCVVADKCGEAAQLKASTGSIEMMRETIDGSFEQVELGTKQIDGNGTWCIQVPMNLDYITTDENGDIVMTKDPSKGIPTRAKVRFKITLEGDDEDGISPSHPLTYYVPSTLTNEDKMTVSGGLEIETYSIRNKSTISKEQLDSIVQKLTYWGNNPNIADEEFKNLCMRDMLWNCVYSVKNYIPRIQTVGGDEPQIVKIGNEEIDEGDPRKIFVEARGYNHTGIKGVNKKNASSLNPLPYNRINLGLSYGAWSLSQALWMSYGDWYDRTSFIPNLRKYADIFWQRSSWLGRFFGLFNFSRRYFYNFRTYENVCSEDEILGKTLEETDSIAYDFYNDWLNGSLYFPKVKFDTIDNGNAPTIDAAVTAKTNGNIYLNDSCCLDFNTYIRDEKSGAYFNYKKIEISDFGPTKPVIKESLFGTENGGKIAGKNWNVFNEDENGINNFATHTASVEVNGGFMYKSVGTSDENNTTYVYSPVLARPITSKTPDGKEIVVYTIHAGFRTDMVLFGSIDENNVLGIPNIRNLKLPRSSSNIVPIYSSEIPFDPGAIGNRSKAKHTSSYEDKLEGQEKEIENAENEIVINEDNFVGLKNGREQKQAGAYWGTAEFTPFYIYQYRWYRYWGGWWSSWWISQPYFIDSVTFFTDRLGGNYSSRDMGMHTLLGLGLFFGRTAFSAFSNMYVTKPKTSINLLRICEMSVVNEDSLARSIYSSAWLNADTIGTITDDQITSPLSRTLFATLNRKKLNVITNGDTLPKYDLKYTPIYGFDGFLNDMILKEGKGSSTTSYVKLRETKSDEYIDFRYGDVKKLNYSFDEQRGNKQRFPVMENSFYFYFGLDAGNTALDKFNEKFG